MLLFKHATHTDSICHRYDNFTAVHRLFTSFTISHNMENNPETTDIKCIAQVFPTNMWQIWQFKMICLKRVAIC